MLVVRLEHKENGIGIFRNPDFLADYSDKKVSTLFEMMMRHNRFNTPSIDGIDMYRNDLEWFCGYKTIEQLQEWITAYEIKVILSNNFNVLLLEVNTYQIGEHQIAFTKESIVSKK